MNFPNLQKFYCSDNQLTTLPLYIMHFRLTYIRYENNPLDLPIQLTRFIDRLQNNNKKNNNIYNDNQNVHNSTIQLSMINSINNITTINITKYNKTKLIDNIIHDKILTCQEQLIEYIHDESIHSVVLLSFGEILWHVLNYVHNNYDIKTQEEIKIILNQEMQDSVCKCFTGRICRLINCLNGFSDLVKIEIHSSEQISNILLLIKDKLGDNYTVEKHVELFTKELEERGYDSKIIEEWVIYISE